uniref:Uncharacterized protein n=1 Tax=Anopheles atroparvus TaxID=41427 RepID=A0AAG5CTY2_ANOAO
MEFEHIATYTVPGEKYRPRKPNGRRCVTDHRKPCRRREWTAREAHRVGKQSLRSEMKKATSRWASVDINEFIF